MQIKSGTMVSEWIRIKQETITPYNNHEQDYDNSAESEGARQQSEYNEIG